MAEMIERENQRISHQMVLFETSNKEIRDYAKEENGKIKEELRQFAKILDNRFTPNQTFGNHDLEETRAQNNEGSIQLQLSVEVLTNQLEELKEK